ncbi:MAG: hypothetical protein ACM3PP_10765 [Candidatus Saccharibacteria bacterium]
MEIEKIEENKGLSFWNRFGITYLPAIIGFILIVLKALMVAAATSKPGIPALLGALLGGVMITAFIAWLISLIRTGIMKRENGWFWIWFALVALFNMLSTVPK